MGYIKEPEGIDFIIKSSSLTKQEEKEISKFIQEYKKKNKIRSRKKRKTLKGKDKVKK